MLINSFGAAHNVLLMRARTRAGLQREMRFWAERGIIHCEDNVHGYSSMSVGTFLRRVDAINDMLGNATPARDTGADANLRAETTRNVERAIMIARIAQDQGMPEDASARRDMLRRRSKTVCVSAGKAIM